MEPLVQDKYGVTYGAGGAIGNAGAHALPSEGASVFVAGRAVVGLEQVAEEIRTSPGLAGAVRVDGVGGRRGEENTGA